MGGPGNDPDESGSADVRAALSRLAAEARPLPARVTERLVLRPWEERDRAPLAALNGDPQVMAHFPAPLDRAASDAMFDRVRLHAQQQGFGVFAVEDRRSGDFVGMMGLGIPPWEAHFTPAVEIGWRFARRHWGQGLAFEAAASTLRWGFDELRLPRVVSFTVQANTRSWRLMERLGMSRRGTFDHPRLPPGHALREHVLYVLESGP